MPTRIARIDTHVIRALVDAIDDTSDSKDWDACRPLFADVIDLDFGSLTGGQPSTVSADALIDSWRENLHPGKPTFH